VAALLLPVAAATARAAAEPAPSASAGATAPTFVFRDYRAPVPPGWQALPPTSSFRVAQYRVPAAPGAGDGEVVVYYFGPGQGGSVAANIARWTSQFSGPQGEPVKPQVQSLRAGPLAATLVELTGRYARQIGMSAGAVGQPGQTLLAAVVETPHGNLTFQLHGDQATVAAQREAFLALLRGLAAS
jgi:hypothetical protein